MAAEFSKIRLFSQSVEDFIENPPKLHITDIFSPCKKQRNILIQIFFINLSQIKFQKISEQAQL